MKILMVNKFLYPKGGAETYFLKIGKHLEEQGHEIQYFGMYSEKNTVGNKFNLYTTEMDFHTSKLSKILYPFRIIYSFEARKKIKRIIKNFKPDIVHLNNINFQLTPSIIEIAHKMNVPIVQTVHDYQMICPNHLLYNDEICEKCIHGSKWNCAKNNCIHESKIKSIIGSIEAILYAKVLKTYEKVDKYICPSEFLKNKLIEANEMYKDKTISIQNFIELKEIPKVKKDDYVLYFGRLAEEKGLEIFIEACKELSDIKFKIAGTGPLEDICKNIDNVEFVGFKTGKELEELIAKAKFSVYPSIWYENCPLSILESESLGTPVITANYGGMKELVDDYETGMLANKINIEELKEKIIKLYFNSELLEKMKKKCIQKRYDFILLDKYCEIILDLYKEIKNNRLTK